ncbi:MAG TPA: hypothetical protein VL947_01505 [Cytophagales bacterium]|nr:hypothetical protein [Cytophagales bacterium]
MQHKPPLPEYKIEMQSSNVGSLLLLFAFFAMLVLLISAPPYNLYWKLTMDGILFVLFFVFLVRCLSKHDAKPAQVKQLLLMDHRGFHYRNKHLFDWDQVNKVDAKQKIKTTGGIVGSDYHLIITLHNGKKIDLVISMLDGDVYDLQAKVLQYARYYG